eukprot:267093-Alexandrium_andersonii.AAC.1
MGGTKASHVGGRLQASFSSCEGILRSTLEAHPQRLYWQPNDGGQVNESARAAHAPVEVSERANKQARHSRQAQAEGYYVPEGSRLSLIHI